MRSIARRVVGVTYAELSIDLPSATWISSVSSDHPEATFEVLAAMPSDDAGFALIEITAPDLETVVTSMGQHQGVADFEPLTYEDGHALVQIETPQPLLLYGAQQAGLPIEFPIRIQDGVAQVEFRASRDRLSELGDSLADFGITYTLEAMHDAAAPDDLLTERQRTLLVTAVEMGYYDSPRECSLTDVAEELDIAKSTCSETLHRAEGLVVKRFVGQFLAE